jgi:hypothetical protein
MACRETLENFLFLSSVKGAIRPSMLVRELLDTERTCNDNTFSLEIADTTRHLRELYEEALSPEVVLRIKKKESTLSDEHLASKILFQYGQHTEQQVVSCLSFWQKMNYYNTKNKFWRW